MLFSPAAPVGSQVCTLTVHTVLRAGNLKSESAARWQVRKTLRHASVAGFVFDLTTLDFAQTPAHGPDQLTADLMALQQHLVVETDAAGRLVRVDNLPELHRQWAALRPRLHAKYRGAADIPPALIDQLGQVLDADALPAALARNPAFGALLPPLYGRVYSAAEPVPGTATVPRFVGELELPFRTEARLMNAAPTAAVAATVQVAGEVDEDRYDAAAARRGLCALADQPNLDARVWALHHESYVFGPRHELVEATRHTRAEVPGVLGQQLTVLLHTRAN
ncbi:hypothetical protein [Hymenobacter cellulosivorans]|uniref:Uncharacterized protein n=1 Tax=Hymenobacter cellulosivorans TaxID=2932249 RepID=A0ABY4F590_9BACT|nr:hypothetical protein [Hymenobacter cellulosivorans]UOQ51735.1 hypothetical protein MUN80_18460 [Hymenobacter cellulosivorans]